MTRWDSSTVTGKYISILIALNTKNTRYILFSSTVYRILLLFPLLPLPICGGIYYWYLNSNNSNSKTATSQHNIHSSSSANTNTTENDNINTNTNKELNEHGVIIEMVAQTNETVTTKTETTTYNIMQTQTGV